MPTSLCEACKIVRAQVLRPRDHTRLCGPCFIAAFEREVHAIIVAAQLFPTPGETVAIGASGGKDSTVLAAVLDTLNRRHGYGLELVLLSVDEGIRGYRDDALATVKRNADRLRMKLCIVGYNELYGGWTMDRVVEKVGKKGNCTYCGVFRRQALDRGALKLGVKHVVTGHNADDVAETVIMNLLRGDLPRLSRGTSIVTAAQLSSTSDLNTNPYGQIKRSKPLKFVYEKEIVLYAHHRKLEYFSTECIYSPEAFRGTARALIKDLERIRPSAILDIVKSGEDMARLCPGANNEGASGKFAGGGCACKGNGCLNEDGGEEEEEEEPPEEKGCGTANGVDEMARVNAYLAKKEHHLVEDEDDTASVISVATTANLKRDRNNQKSKTPAKQKLGQCENCGYLSSQRVCKACLLLEDLNKDQPKWRVETETETNINALERTIEIKS